MIHKRILDVADSNPDASMAEIADSIPGASTDLVERVLEEYGDPVEEAEGGSAGTGGATSEQATSDADTMTNENDQMGETRPELSRKQLDTLRLIGEEPNASQGDLAEAFDVTRATISRWLNDIPGFEWARRREIAAELLDDEEIGESTREDESESTADLRQRMDAIERRLDELDAEATTAVLDPELAHKVVHACMKSERITEREELQLLRTLMG